MSSTFLNSTRKLVRFDGANGLHGITIFDLKEISLVHNERFRNDGLYYHPQLRIAFHYLD